jgi:ABC-type multidrug transport system ATPase subunit
VYQYGMILGFSKKEMDAIYDDIIAYSGLEKYQYMRLKNYSSGMRVKLGFSTAVRIDPDILVLDEIMSVGDVSFKEKSQQKILEFCNSDKTVVIVSHSMTTISELCDRAIFLKDGKIGMIGETEKVIDAYLEAMHGNLAPKDLVYARGHIRDREAQKKEQELVHLLHRQISDLHLTPILRDCYDSGTENAIYENITLKNIKNFSQLEEILSETGGSAREEEYLAGSRGFLFLRTLGEENRARVVATRLIKNLFSDGFVSLGNNTRTEFFSETESPVSGNFSTILVRDGLRTIPVLFEKDEHFALDNLSAYQILKSTRCKDPLGATLVLPPELCTEKAIAVLKENKIRLLVPVPVQMIEEHRDLQDFMDGIVSPDRMQEFLDKPLFVKKDRFAVQGIEIDGYGFFNPQQVLKEYTSFFKILDITNRMFEETGRTYSQNPEDVLQKTARINSKYFSVVQKDGTFVIEYNLETIRHREKLIGTTFLYHSGDWDAMECYRNYEKWRLIQETVSLYSKIVLADEPIGRGKALLALIDYAIWAGMI